MASFEFVYKHASFCHNGPRLGVYPLQQMEHYRAVSWRACQLKQPQAGYRNKSRSEITIPGPPPLPLHFVRQESSSTSTSTSVRIHRQSKQENTLNKESTGGRKFIITTAPMAIQPRPPQKERSTPPALKCQTPPTPLSQYPDPLEVKGDCSFEERLAVIAQHEVNTIKQEEWHRAKKNLGRPSSARSTSSRPVSSRRLSSSKSVTGRSNLLSTAKARKSSAPNTTSDTDCITQRQLPASSFTSGLENYPPTELKNSLLPETSRDETTTEDKMSPIPLEKPCIITQSDTDDSKADNLNVTSDLGLSVDSLSLSGDDNDLPLDSKFTEKPGVEDNLTTRTPVSFEILISPHNTKGKKVKS